MFNSFNYLHFIKNSTIGPDDNVLCISEPTLMHLLRSAFNEGRNAHEQEMLIYDPLKEGENSRPIECVSENELENKLVIKLY